MESNVKWILDKMKASIINPILNKKQGDKVTGWHCKAYSDLFFDRTIQLLVKRILKDDIPYSVQTLGNNEIEFFIFITDKPKKNDSI